MKSDQRKRELATIHVAKKQLGLDDATYRDILWTVARVKSAAELDSQGRGRLIKHLQERGFRKSKAPAKRSATPGRFPGHPGKVGNDREAMLGKVEALLADMKLPWSYADGIASQMFGIERVRFCEPTHLRALIAALSKRQRRQHEDQ